MVHKTAVLASGCELGSDVKVGPFSYIESDVRIGDGCVIGPHVTILRHTSLGSNCSVHSCAVLGDVPQDIGFAGCDSGVRIGSNCRIREGVTIHRGSGPGTFTEVGDGCFLMAFSHVAHNVRLGRDVILANGVLLAGHVEVGDGAFIGGNAGVHQFVKIGRLAMLGGGSALSKDLPPFCTLRPAALNRIAGLNVVGMRRAGLTAVERDEIKRAFKIIYRSGRNVKQAMEYIEETFHGGPALEFCEFIRRSTRGICGAGSEA